MLRNLGRDSEDEDEETDEQDDFEDYDYDDDYDYNSDDDDYISARGSRRSRQLSPRSTTKSRETSVTGRDLD